MLVRHLAKTLKQAAAQYPIVTLTGPRQAGKSTLTKIVFPKYRYISLEDPDIRQFAESDPRAFLQVYSRHVIFDEIQRVPELFSYLQTQVDADNESGRFILTGSQQFLLNSKISQTLAGRTALLKLLPFSLAELLAVSPQICWQKKKLMNRNVPDKSLYQFLYEGLYPRLHDKALNPKQFYRDYVDTYVTRDLQSLLQVGDLRKFQIFLRLLAGRVGQRVNLTALGNDTGVSHSTISHWLSVLEASYIIYVLPPHFANFNKRLVKSPKIYFFDTGLLCYLLRIQSADDLIYHPSIGSIFESFIFSEIYKNFIHQGEEAPLYFWQDRTGNEIDLLIDQGRKLLPIEIKSAKTIHSQFLEHINNWLKLKDNPQDVGFLVYGGDEWQKRNGIQILPWYAVS